MSTGHARAPLQVSATSHSPTDARQTVEAGIGEQMPAEPLSAHESQAPAAHAVLQHTPSAQKPEEHSVVLPHAAPAPF